MSELRRFLELHPTMTEDTFTVYRKHRNRYASLKPSPTPHTCCEDCPMREDCPLKYYVKPCVFRTIAKAREVD